MKKILIITITLVSSVLLINAQEVIFEEYDLDNGLHVILHQDNAAPVVAVTSTYHVGAKDEDPNRTGFAHFFEHLLFTGTKNIERGKWDEIISSHGGSDNATTNDDRTYYFMTLPSNNLELGLWMESERLLHPVIDQQAVDTQNEVVKEEKRMRVDNSPYGRFLENVKKHLFKNHPYRWTTIGEMEHLDAATLKEFQEFNKKFYIPNNAVLSIAGDIDIAATKKMVKDYFGPIPRGSELNRSFPKEDPITETIHAKAYDPNIKIPAIMAAYRTPSFKEKDAYVLDMISNYLSNGKSSKLYKKLVDEQKMALQTGAINLSQEDYSMYVVYGLPLGEVSLDTFLAEIDEEIVKVQNELISERDYQKLQNQFENQFVNSNSSVLGIAGSLANYYMMFGNTDLINNEIDIYRSITREDIQAVAKKYLNPNQRLILEYLPENKEE